jgi:hypothetical protein
MAILLEVPIERDCLLQLQAFHHNEPPRVAQRVCVVFVLLEQRDGTLPVARANTLDAKSCPTYAVEELDTVTPPVAEPRDKQCIGLDDHRRKLPPLCVDFRKERTATFVAKRSPEHSKAKKPLLGNERAHWRTGTRGKT